MKIRCLPHLASLCQPAQWTRKAIVHSSRRSMSSSASSASSSAAGQNAPTNNAAESEGRRKKIVVFGGNGYVGQAIVKEALSQNIDVISINRSGKPEGFSWQAVQANSVEWVKGNILEEGPWKERLIGADGAISCVGAFGSNEFMMKINGDANINAISEANIAGVPRFVYISTVENNLPSFILRGYFEGKRRAEEVLLDAYHQGGVVLRPSFIYGTRQISVPFANISVGLPLSIVGKPLDSILNFTPLKVARDALPGMKAVLAPPVAVEDLARAAVAASIGDLSSLPESRIMSVDDIKRASRETQAKK